MKRIDIDSAIRLHTQWRRQFLNAFAGGNYADMPLSAHRSCMLAITLSKAEGIDKESATYRQLTNEILELSNNGLADCADLLLPELNEASHQLVGQLDKLRLVQA